VFTIIKINEIIIIIIIIIIIKCLVLYFARMCSFLVFTRAHFITGL
jgi:hypothetical protein